jgi:hypothetical protein
VSIRNTLIVIGEKDCETIDGPTMYSRDRDIIQGVLTVKVHSNRPRARFAAVPLLSNR